MHIFFAVVTDSVLEKVDTALLLISPSRSLIICHRQQINNMDRWIKKQLTSTQNYVSLYYLHQNSSNYLPDDGLTDLNMAEY